MNDTLATIQANPLLAGSITGLAFGFVGGCFLSLDWFFLGWKYVRDQFMVIYNGVCLFVGICIGAIFHGSLRWITIGLFLVSMFAGFMLAFPVVKHFERRYGLDADGRRPGKGRRS